MHAAIAIRRALRVGGSGMRALLLARNALHLTMDVALPADVVRSEQQLRVRPWRRFGGDAGAEGHSWSNREVLAVGVAASAMSVIAGGEALCEALEGEEDDSEDDESAVRHKNCNLCRDSDDNDNMSIYFDAEYEPKKLLGCGTFGVVMQCVHKETGRVAAVKMVQDIAGNQEEVDREKEALGRLERAGGHENIVGYEGSYYHNDFHYIVLEYVAGISLHSFVEKHSALDATWALKLVSQLASALQFMHEADVIHRDLKPENVMALVNCDGKGRSSARGDANENEDVTLKIIDFGSAGRASQPESSNKARATTLSGTRCYWPPEVLQLQGMTAAMDMWALGCILYILISGRHPFDLSGCSTEDEVIQRIKTEPVSFLLPVWHDVPEETKELIRGLLEKDPRHRLSADQVLEHPAVVEATKEL
ncbi:CAMK protein kinase [Phytophthora cinnamomi]|uniref:CAMK protein kinase n=1 Tax=Phytophthora cinnamomi TaxID=4785 RepID=UPI00355A555B|nr:CAMK protein kinase [Phytophthora cinnamomi]